jgi:hypothetical protein
MGTLKDPLKNHRQGIRKTIWLMCVLCFISQVKKELMYMLFPLPLLLMHVCVYVCLCVCMLMGICVCVCVALLGGWPLYVCVALLGGWPLCVCMCVCVCVCVYGCVCVCIGSGCNAMTCIVCLCVSANAMILFVCLSCKAMMRVDCCVSVGMFVCVCMNACVYLIQRCSAPLWCIPFRPLCISLRWQCIGENKGKCWPIVRNPFFKLLGRLTLCFWFCAS